MSQEEEVVEVRMLEVPTALYAQQVAHLDELLREFMHVANSQSEDQGSIPRRLLEIMEMVRSTYGRATAAVRERVYVALDTDVGSVDVVLPVRPDAGEDARELLATLDEADSYCRSGDLLTLAPSPELLAFRRWYLNEVIRQTAGQPPRPWSAYREQTLGV